MLTVSSLQTAFADYECDDESIWDDAMLLAKSLALTADSLQECYEVFVLKRCALTTGWQSAESCRHKLVPMFEH